MIIPIPQFDLFGQNKYWKVARETIQQGILPQASDHCRCGQVDSSTQTGKGNDKDPFGVKPRAFVIVDDDAQSQLDLKVPSKVVFRIDGPDVLFSPGEIIIMCIKND